MHAAPHRRYERVAIVAWDCLVSAGDARAAWLACSGGTSNLEHTPERGWHGRISSGPSPSPPPAHARLLDSALRAARRPWSSIAASAAALAFSASTSKGDPWALEQALAGDPARFIESLPGQLSGQLARALRLPQHVGHPVAAACSTGLYGLLEAADLLERGVCARALVGAADCSLTPLILAGFRSLGVLCEDRVPTAFAEPTGFAPAEGAGFFALAPDGPWRLRAGVRLGDASHETTLRDPETLRASLAALWAALPAPGLIVTHGTGTASGDAYERACLDHGPWATAPRLACKPFIGHCLGASGAVELALALEAPVTRLWKISLGFGGHVAAVALERDSRA